MRKSRIFMLATALSLGAAVPALAAIDEIGAVDVSGDHFTQATWTKFGGPIQNLGFLSQGGNVDCDRITIHYGSGMSQEVFSGVLYNDQRQSMFFQDGPRDIRAIDFVCRAENGVGGHIALNAGVGGIPTASSSPAPAIYAGDEAGWTPAPTVTRAPIAPTPIMTQLASPEFGRLNDRSIMLSGDSRLNFIALQPVGADAQCRPVTAKFDDGSSNTLVVNDGAPLKEGRIYRVPVTGQDRNLDAIGLTCQAQNSEDVTIKVYGVG